MFYLHGAPEWTRTTGLLLRRQTIPPSAACLSAHLTYVNSTNRWTMALPWHPNWYPVLA